MFSWEFCEVFENSCRKNICEKLFLKGESGNLFISSLIIVHWKSGPIFWNVWKMIWISFCHSQCCFFKLLEVAMRIVELKFSFRIIFVQWENWMKFFSRCLILELFLFIGFQWKLFSFGKRPQIYPWIIQFWNEALVICKICRKRKNWLLIQFHANGLFLYPLKTEKLFSGGKETNQCYEMG